MDGSCLGNDISIAVEFQKLFIRTEIQKKQESGLKVHLEPLAQILGPILKDGTINSITAKIKGEKRGHQREFGFREVWTRGIQGAIEERAA